MGLFAATDWDEGVAFNETPQVTGGVVAGRVPLEVVWAAIGVNLV